MQHFNDCEHTVASMDKLTEYIVPEVLMCTLSGPFTSEQKALGLSRISVDRSKVKTALIWLMRNNLLYKNLKLPSDTNFPEPLIVDHSTLIDGLNTRIETVFETTIIFPETNQIHENNGGNQTKEEFLKDVMKDKREHHMICHPTPNGVKLYEGDNLAKCFPLQFPYGTGIKERKIDILKYLKYIVDVSIPCFQTGEFVLPLFNLYAKTEVVRRASMRCKYKLSESMNTGDVINKISTDELEERISRLGANRQGGDRNTQKLMDSVYAISK
jgi:hypothetical protein